MAQIYTDEALAQFRRFMELRAKRDETKEAAKTAEDEYRDMESEVWEDLAPDDPNAEDYKLPSIKVDLGEPWGTVTFGVRETIYGRIIDDEAALEHYEGRALLDEVSAPKFVMARINEEVRDRYENGKSMPPGVDWRAVRYVSITRAK